jgi:hypothetical protein
MLKVRHQVAIAGRVTCSQTPAACPPTVLTAAGNGIQHNACFKPEGIYYFLDLPDGEYVVEASALEGGSRYSSVTAKAQVSRTSGGHGERIVPAIVDLVLRETTVRGQVRANKAPVVLAEVRVKGSGERTFTDSQGHYVLAGIEKGNRTIQVFAPSYAPAEKAAKLQSPGSVVQVDFTLTRA